MNKTINLSKVETPVNWGELALIALIAWGIGHIVALIILWIVNPLFQNNIIYNGIYLTVVIGIAMLVIDNKIPEKMIALPKEKSMEQPKPIIAQPIEIPIVTDIPATSEQFNEIKEVK